MQRPLPVPVSGLAANVSEIGGGTNHACAIQASAVKCWGANWSGQLGDGSTFPRSTPVSVTNAGADMVAVAAGYHHTCALRNDGALLCWGDNGHGQLGDGTTTSRHVAAPVIGLAEPAVGVALTNAGTCALLANGTVQCFGEYVLGIGAMSFRPVPVEVGTVSGGIATLSAGATHTCGTTGNAAAVCFGTGDGGQLGMGPQRVAPVPAIVPTLPGGVAQVSAGAHHTCARSLGGEAICWGQGGSGELGNGQTANSNVPVRVAGLAIGVGDIAGGIAFSCAVDGAGAAKCWGSDSGGTLGNGAGVQSSTVPVQVAGLVSGVTRITAGGEHACALRAGGGVKCWGRNWQGQVGDGTTVDRYVPVDVPGLAAGILDIDAGRSHTCAVTATGSVLCWGSNNGGQLGDRTNVERTTPVSVPGLPAAALRVAAGDDHTCALLAGGAVYCWGSNSYGQTGPNGGGTGPAIVPLDVSALSITAGTGHSCAVASGGRALCWGMSLQSQLGNGDVAYSPVPRFVVVGDFGSTVTLASSPNPSRHGEHVTIVARLTAAESVPEGRVSFTDAGAPLRCNGVWDPVVIERGEARCTLPLLVGVHDLRADYGGSGDALPSQGVLQHTVLGVAGQHCAGFDDVDATDPFCASVEWLRNREITLGCRAFDYCPSLPVSRLAMAAFMDRLGGVFAPESLLEVRSPFLLVSGPLQCEVAIPVAAHPRRAVVDAVVSATSDDIADATFETAYHLFVAPYTDAAAGPPVRVAMSPTVPTAVRLQGTVDIDAEQQLAVGIRVQAASQLGSLTSATCIVRAMVFNRDVLHAPFDVPTGDKP